MAETLCVPPERVAAMWPHVEGFLRAAVERCGDWTLPSLRGCLDRTEMLLWVLWDGDAIRAAAVTQVSIVPRGKICSIVVAGGREVGDFPAAIEAIEAYARQMGCVAMRIEGREGWRRALPDYRLDWVVLEKGLN